MKITIISTFSDDLIISKKGIKKSLGGPAFFITKFLKDNNFSFELITGDKGLVEIDMLNNKELGKIESVNKFDKKISKREGLVLFSTLLKEFDLDILGDFNCVDIQGFVRDGNIFGGKKKFECEVLSRFDLIKGTKEEIEYISLDKLKKDCVIIKTNGTKGFEVFFNNKNYFFKVEKINCINTVGAGDTFFVAFCVNYFETKDIISSATFAKKKLIIF